MPASAPVILPLALQNSTLVIGGVTLAVAVLLIVVGARRKAASAASAAEREAAASGPRPMDAGRFWALVEGARAAAGADPLHRPDHLVRALRALEPAEIAAFAASYGREKLALYTEDLRLASHLVLERADEAAFSHFRDWLLSEGRATCEAVRRDPEALAELGPARTLEAFGYAAKRAHKARAGRALPGDVFLAEPTLDPAAFDRAAAAARFPRLGG